MDSESEGAQVENVREENVIEETVLWCQINILKFVVQAWRNQIQGCRDVRPIQAPRGLFGCDSDSMKGERFVADGSEQHHGAGTDVFEHIPVGLVSLKLDELLSCIQSVHPNRQELSQYDVAAKKGIRW